MSTATPVLTAHLVSKSFGGVHALTDANLVLHRHEVLGLVGANGAGKTTLVRIVTGDLQPDSGEITVLGTPARFRGVQDAFDAGIGVVRQELHLVPALLVAENIFLGDERRFVRRGKLDRRRMIGEAAGLLEPLGLDTSTAGRRLDSLSIGDRQLVAAARALRHAGSMLILDEPTSSLTPWEVGRLFGVVRDLKERGVSVVYISHRLDEVTELCDRVTVLRDGRTVCDVHDPANGRDEIVTEMLPGSDTGRRRRRRATLGDTVLSVRDIAAGRHGPASFEVRSGEIVGMFGLVGAGRSTICKAIAGVIRRDGGTLEVAGRWRRFKSPAEALEAGVAYMPEDRRGEGLLSGMSVASNMIVGLPEGVAGRTGILRKKIIDRMVGNLVDRLSIKTPGITSLVDHLSGGNQQKTIVGRQLSQKLRVLLLDEPTHGIDVAAKADLLGLLEDLAADGLGIVYLSSELDELVATVDRVLVVRSGQIVADFPTDTSEHEILAAAVGGGSSQRSTDGD